jgi:hypothetical protein
MSTTASGERPASTVTKRFQAHVFNLLAPVNSDSSQTGPLVMNWRVIASRSGQVCPIISEEAAHEVIPVLVQAKPSGEEI